MGMGTEASSLEGLGVRVRVRSVFGARLRLRLRLRVVGLGLESLWESAQSRLSHTQPRLCRY